MKFLSKLFTILFIFGTAPNVFADNVVAEYGKGNKITDEEMTKWLMLSTGGKMPENKNKFSELNPKMKQNLVQNFVLNKVLEKAAKESPVQRSKMFQHQLENAKNMLMIKLYLDKYAKREITNSKLKKEYRNFVKMQKNSDDLSVSHILIDSESKANEVYKNLKKGKSFSEMAKTHSMDKSTKDKGGKYGKVSRGQILPDYEKAAYKLKKGQFSKPVQTQMGWFIIQVDDRTKKDIPSFDKIKPQLEMAVKQQIIDAYMKKLLKKADIQLKN